MEVTSSSPIATLKIRSHLPRFRSRPDSDPEEGPEGGTGIVHAGEGQRDRPDLEKEISLEGRVRTDRSDRHHPALAVCGPTGSRAAWRKVSGRPGWFKAPELIPNRRGVSSTEAHPRGCTRSGTYLRTVMYLGDRVEYAPETLNPTAANH